MKKLFLIFCILFLLSSLSCGGGSSSGSGSSTGHAPIISDLYVSQTQAALNSGGGSVSIHVDFYFADADGDIVSLTLFNYDKNGNAILEAPVQLSGLSGKTSGRNNGTIIWPTTERGTTAFGIFVTDSQGRQSNRLFANFTVY